MHSADPDNPPMRSADRSGRLIDTHCHLTHGRLRRQVPAVLERAAAAGVDAVICAVGNVAESREAASLAGDIANVFCTAGVHPHDAAAASGNYLRQIEQIAAHSKNVAIGEIGLDYHYEYSPRADQRRVFAEQLDLARRLGKPVVIHTREAFDDTLAVLAETGADGRHIVFHSFTGPVDQARRALDLGAMISFSGIVTFNRASDIRESAALVSDDRLLVETDAPFLSPEPVRQMKTNEPANTAYTAACLADIRRTTPTAIAHVTTTNAVRFFSLQM
ncbi:MAG: TatD family hydrolase [Planctomycetes bacterium]|nr:TatD family hydrolase [Planctomycetota bacterium]